MSEIRKMSELEITMFMQIQDLRERIARLESVLREVEAWDLNWADGLDANVERIKNAVRAVLDSARDFV